LSQTPISFLSRKKFFRIIYTVYLIFGLISNICFSQISLTYPKNRMVFQRNAFNVANLYLEGTIIGQAEMVQARLSTLDQAGNPKIPLETSNWANIAAPQNGVFSGALFNQNAGWYSLEVRYLNQGQAIDTSAAIKVGVGEVFVIAGQSNATGQIPFRDPAIFAPTNDGVNCINLMDTLNTTPPEMVFSHLQSNSNISPIGVTAWCWGVFGEQVANNWNVPVLVFNTARGNTSIFDWRASANGGTDICGCKPYDQLKKVLDNYTSKTGIRAILWHQGESDFGNFEGAGLGPEVYKSNLKQVIDKSRADFQNNISWVVAKVSRVQDYTSARVTGGQQMIVDSANYNTYLGPLSDNIQPSAAERDVGGVHFWGQGLTDLGNSWFDSVNNYLFITNSTPQNGKFSIIGCSSKKSGNWADSTTWSGGRVPNLNDDVIISANTTVILNEIGHLKNLTLVGELQLGAAGGELKFGE
jgi:Carbohydrate esterase, sialic acid-specific acetylesterase